MKKSCLQLGFISKKTLSLISLFIILIILIPLYLKSQVSDTSSQSPITPTPTSFYKPLQESDINAVLQKNDQELQITIDKIQKDMHVMEQLKSNTIIFSK